MIVPKIANKKPKIAGSLELIREIARMNSTNNAQFTVKEAAVKKLSMSIVFKAFA